MMSTKQYWVLRAGSRFWTGSVDEFHGDVELTRSLFGARIFRSAADAVQALECLDTQIDVGVYLLRGDDAQTADEIATMDDDLRAHEADPVDAFDAMCAGR